MEEAGDRATVKTTQPDRRAAMALVLRLCRLTGVHQDPCVLDVFSCAICLRRATPTSRGSNASGGGGRGHARRRAAAPGAVR